MKKGKVYLAGAGPGDPGLLTVKTKKLIQQADVILYDRLIGDSILSLLPESKETYDVGKLPGLHKVPQEKINEMLVSFAKAGKNVLRLKGGDPFVFGRGGEEVEALIKENIPYEIVPGITSAIAGPAYGGIPITHRDYNRSFHIITGHQKKDPLSQKDFDQYAKLENSVLVFLMSMAHVETIVKGLLSSGMKESTPCAVISNGTRYNQKTSLFSLGKLAEKIPFPSFETPGLFLVGDVSGFSKKFTWFYDLPLQGERIIVTRPEEKGGTLSERLSEYGAELIHFPTIRLFPLNIEKEIKKLSSDLSSYEWILFTSSYGIKTFFTSLKEYSIDFRILHNIKFAVVGEGTGKALENYGFIPDFIPKNHYGKDLAKEILPLLSRDKKVLLILPKNISSDAADLLEKENISVSIIESYDKSFRKKKLFNPLEKELFIFTSPSTVEGFLYSFSKDEIKGMPAVCIGKKTASSAQKAGFKTLTPKETSSEGIIKEILTYHERKINEL